MDDYEYEVLENNRVIAKCMTLNNALTLAKAIFQDRYLEHDESVTIRRITMDKTISVEEYETAFDERSVF